MFVFWFTKRKFRNIGLVIHRWKGLENNFHTVYSMPRNSKNCSRKKKKKKKG
jgi:hypothetical protein